MGLILWLGFTAAHWMHIWRGLRAWGDVLVAPPDGDKVTIENARPRRHLHFRRVHITEKSTERSCLSFTEITVTPSVFTKQDHGKYYVHEN